MSDEEFRATYRGTAVLRTKRRGLARNAAVALGNVVDDRAIPLLISALTQHDESLVRGHAAWALGRHADRTARQALERALAVESDDFSRVEIRLALESTGA
jgi:epoxyqueuosine reductase